MSGLVVCCADKSEIDRLEEKYDLILDRYTNKLEALTEVSLLSLSNHGNEDCSDGGTENDESKCVHKACGGLLGRLLKLSHSCDDLKTQYLYQMQDKVNFLASQVEILQKDLKSQEEEMTSQNEELKMEMKNQEARFTENLEEEGKKCQGKLDDLAKATRDASEEMKKDFEDKIDKQARDIESLQTELKQQEVALKSQEDKIRSQAIDIQNLEAELKKKEAEFTEKLEEESKKWQAKLDDQNNVIGNQAVSLSDHSKMLQLQNTEIQRANTFYGFSATPTGNKEYSKSGSQILFARVTSNIGGAYDSSKSEFLCPVHGYYYFSVSCRSNSSKRCTSSLVIDNTVMAYTYADGSRSKSYAHSANSAVVECNVGQKVWVKSISSNTYVYGSYYNMFSGILIQKIK